MESANISSGEICDLISSLPDPILHHTLGLLDTKESPDMCAVKEMEEPLDVFTLP